MVDIGSNLASSLELFLGAHPTREVSRGPVLRCLLPGRQGLQVMVGTQTGAVPRPPQEAARHHRLLRGLEDRPNQDMRGCVWSRDPQCARPLGEPDSGQKKDFMD